MGVETAVLGGGLGALGGLGYLGYKQTKAQNKAINANNATVANTQRVLNNALSTVQKDYQPYELDLLDSPAFTDYRNQLVNTLGTGYQKATESIAPQLRGEVQPLVNEYLNELLPAARSAAIDQGAYGGSRDMLTRERVLNNLNQEITNAAARDIADQRAQYASLTGADAAQMAQMLSALTAKTDLQNQYSDYLYNAALNYANAMSGAGTMQVKSSGLDNLLNIANTAANVVGAVAKTASAAKGG